MKPAPFEYVAPRTRAEAVDALADGQGTVLAGGQSLVLEMNYRTRRPARLVDINRVDGFAGLSIVDGALRVGPLVRHRAFESGVADGPTGRLLRDVARHIAHPPIRARGTMLGSLAYAHPAAEWPSLAVLLDATLTLNERTVAAEDFFTGPFETVRRPEELLLLATLPLLPDGTKVAFIEHRRTHATFAQLAVMVAVEPSGARRIALVNAGRVRRAREAEAAQSVAEAGSLAARYAEPRPQEHTDEAYQRHTIAVLVQRALKEAR
jgi:carbon-monoxide dehydrogenase medium subunit